MGKKKRRSRNNLSPKKRPIPPQSRRVNLWKRLPLITILTFLLSVFSVQWCWYNYVRPLSISPKEKRIFCSESQYKRETFYASLTNRSSGSLYDVQVFTAYPEGVELSVKPEGKRPEIQQLRGIEVDTSSMFIESTSPLAMDLRFNNLHSNEVVKLRFEVNKEKCGGLDSFMLRPELKFSRTPMPVFRRASHKFPHQ